MLFVITRINILKCVNSFNSCIFKSFNHFFRNRIENFLRTISFKVKPKSFIFSFSSPITITILIFTNSLKMSIPTICFYITKLICKCISKNIKLNKFRPNNCKLKSCYKLFSKLFRLKIFHNPIIFSRSICFIICEYFLRIKQNSTRYNCIIICTRCTIF